LLDALSGRKATAAAATLASGGLIRRAQRFRHAYTGRVRHAGGRLCRCDKANLKVRLYV